MWAQYLAQFKGGNVAPSETENGRSKTYPFVNLNEAFFEKN